MIFNTNWYQSIGFFKDVPAGSFLTFTQAPSCNLHTTIRWHTIGKRGVFIKSWRSDMNLSQRHANWQIILKRQLACRYWTSAPLGMPLLNQRASWHAAIEPARQLACRYWTSAPIGMPPLNQRASWHAAIEPALVGMSLTFLKCKWALFVRTTSS
jgi:hypothetical protein